MSMVKEAMFEADMLSIPDDAGFENNDDALELHFDIRRLDNKLFGTQQMVVEAFIQLCDVLEVETPKAIKDFLHQRKEECTDVNIPF